MQIVMFILPVAVLAFFVWVALKYMRHREGPSR